METPTFTLKEVTPIEIPLAERIKNMSIARIANLIRKDWGAKIYFGARPYLDAMFSLDTVNDNYGYDTGKSIVAYFLSNAQTWKGEIAKIVKAELNKQIKR